MKSEQTSEVSKVNGTANHNQVRTLANQKNNQNKAKKTRKNNSVIYVSSDQSPNTRIYATKTLNISNKIVFSGLDLFSMIGLNIAVIKGGLVKYRAYDGLQYIDDYLKTLITNTNTIIKDEIAVCDEHLDHFAKKGYEFVNNSKVSKCEFKLFTNAAAELIHTYELLDELSTKISFLEKCDHFPSATKVLLERQWMTLPKSINSRVLALQKKLESRFKINLKRAQSDPVPIDKNTLKNLLQQTTKTRSKINTMDFATLPELETKKVASKPKQTKKITQKKNELEEF